MLVFFIAVVGRVECLRGMPGVSSGPKSRDIIGSGGSHGPEVAVGTNVSVDEKIVVEDKIPRQSVMVRSIGFSKQNQARVPVPLWYIAEHLIVGAIFFQDVENVLNGSSFRVDGGE